MKKASNKTKATKATPKKKRFVFSPDPNLKSIERGNEFLALKRQKIDGKKISNAKIVEMYNKKGVKLSLPTVYTAIALAEAPQFVHEAIEAGDIMPTSVLPMLSKAKNEQALRRMVNKLIAERKRKARTLKAAGFEGDASLKMTKFRRLRIVAKSLQKIQESGALESARAQAVLAFIEELESEKTAEELVKELTQ